MIHGTTKTYKKYACRCEPCRLNYSRYNKRRDYLAKSGRPLRLPAIGTQRRIRALMALGYSLPTLAGELGIAVGNLSKKFHQPNVNRDTYERVAELYERLAMKPPPTGWQADRTRGIGSRRGWPTPLCWEDIDDPDEKPNGLRRSWQRGPSPEDYDENVVLRILGGEYRLHATPAERREVVRRWDRTDPLMERHGRSDEQAEARNLAYLARLTGWKVERYTDREEGAA